MPFAGARLLERDGTNVVGSNIVLSLASMSDKYRIFRGDEVCFVTLTIVEWLKVLADDNFKNLLINAIKYYQKNRGLTVFGYCTMPNHVPMLALPSRVRRRAPAGGYAFDTPCNKKNTLEIYSPHMTRKGWKSNKNKPEKIGFFENKPNLWA
jgi:hypothetical protein